MDPPRRLKGTEPEHGLLSEDNLSAACDLSGLTCAEQVSHVALDKAKIAFSVSPIL